MQPFRVQTTVDQLAEHLRTEIQSGGLSGEMPGVAQLVRTLGVGTTTVVAALEILKRDGLLEAKGERRRSRIADQKQVAHVGLKVRILLYEDSDAHDEHMVSLGFKLQERGHQVEYATKTLIDLDFNVERVAKMVQKNDGNAWVIRSGSRPVLEWFAEQPIPSFAMFGRQTGIPMASLATLKSPAMLLAIQRLVTLGHRRIVLLTREERRKPTPGLLERRFIEELERLEITTGAYNLPDWENNPQHLHQCLSSLFQRTPPTALLISEPALFFAVQNYLLTQGLVVPRDVSLLSLEKHPSFEWFRPRVSLIQTDSQRWVPRVVQWAENVAKGKEDKRETLIQSKFIEGGTIGPPPRR